MLGRRHAGYDGPSGVALLALALLGCTPPPPETVEVASLTLHLSTPADVDPLDGADTLAVTVTDPSGAVLAEAEGSPDEGLSLPGLDVFGVVDVAVTAKSGDTVLSAGRSGPVVVREDADTDVDVLFLPVNEPVRLDQAPLVDRLDHLTIPTPDDRVLLVGGRKPSSSEVYQDSEWWDPFDGFTASGPPLPEPMYAMSSTTFDDRTTLVAGGYWEIDDAAVDAFTVPMDGSPFGEADELDYPRAGHCLATFQGSSALAIGGRQDLDSDRTLEVLRPNPTGAGSSWATLLMETLVTSDVTGCVGAGSNVLTIGRESGWGVFSLENASNDEIPKAWHRMDGGVDLDGAMLVPVDDDTIRVLGGWDGVDVRADGWTAKLAERDLSVEGKGLPTPRAWGQWRWWEDGRSIAVAGGWKDGTQSSPNTAVEIVGLDTGPMVSVDLPIKLARLDVVQGGALLFTGGIVIDSGEPAGAWMVMPWPEVP